MALIGNVSAKLFDRDRFPLTLLVVAIGFSACLMPAQSDTWWHLRAGEEIWRAGRVNLQDNFTHTVTGEPWPDHEWLTQVVFYATHVAGGMPLLTLLCASSVTVAWLIVASLTPAPPLFRIALVGIGAALSSGAWSLRPQVLTMALFAATLWILVRRTYLCSLPLLFLAWANLHGAVALGGVLIASAALASLKAGDGWFTRLTAIGGLCVVATILTPLGLSLWLEMPQMIQRISAYGIQEWRATGFSTWGEWAFWATGGSMIALAVANRKAALQSSHALTLVISTILLFIMAARSARQVTPFFMCAVPAIAAMINFQKRNESAGQTSRANALIVRNAVFSAGCVIAGAVFITYAWSAPLPRLGWAPLPTGVVATIEKCPGPLYNRYDDGGALLWFMKSRKIFIDGRQDPFPKELVLQHMAVERSGDYQELFERYQVGCALTHQGLPLAARLRSDGWHERRAGGTWIVYSRPAKQVAARPL
jgi:hypothetical protein